MTPSLALTAVLGRDGKPVTLSVDGVEFSVQSWTLHPSSGVLTARIAPAPGVVWREVVRGWLDMPA